MPGKVYGERDVNQALKDVQEGARQRELPGQRPKAEARLASLKAAGGRCGCNAVTKGTGVGNRQEGNRARCCREGFSLPLFWDRWEAIGVSGIAVT